MVPGATNCTVAVPAVPDARLRPSDGAICAFDATYVATIIGPGTLCNVALVWRPHHGSGYDPLSLISGRKNGGTMRQKFALGDASPDRLVTSELPMEAGIVAAGRSALPTTSQRSVISCPRF